MRKFFEQQLSLGYTPIHEVKIPEKMRTATINLTAALKYIFVTPKWNKLIFKLLDSKISKTKKKTGRNGMSLWEIFVLSQVRLCLNITYDELHEKANCNSLVRGILGVQSNGFMVNGKTYTYQNIYDNVTLIDGETLKEINEVIVKMGHKVFKKKETSPLRLKTDSFVVETSTHFPTDYNLLWDCTRKCIETIEKLGITKWRNSKDWKKKLKIFVRELGRVSVSGGKNKTERLEKAARKYIKKTKKLSRKVQEALNHDPSTERELDLMIELIYYNEMLLKHIDLVERRILQGEKIPHNEKIFSIFQPFVEMYKKGKLNGKVEIGKKVTITTDENHLIMDWEINGKADSKLLLPIIDRLLAKYKIKSISTDKGFSSKEDKELLKLYIEDVIIPKRGKLNKEEKQDESKSLFKKLRNKHSAVESNINELEHRGLNKCPDRTYENFKRYVGLACTSYNLHKIGRELMKQKRKSNKKIFQAA